MVDNCVNSAPKLPHAHGFVSELVRKVKIGFEFQNIACSTH